MINKHKRYFSMSFNRFLIWIFLIIIFVTSVRSSIIDWYDIPTGSMEPTILIGDRVYVNKLAYGLKIPYSTIHLYKWANPKRGDIVVFYSPENQKRLAKRIIGLPGDEISMMENHLRINGKEIKYTPLKIENSEQFNLAEHDDFLFLSENLAEKKHAVMFSTVMPSSKGSFSSITIPKDKYFIMGDNRDNSGDSRYFGLVDRKLIVGKATMVVYSKKGSLLKFRWSRFFETLR